MSELKIALTRSQIEFFNLDCNFPLFCAGYGSGKSYIMGFCAVQDALHSSDTIIGIYEPDYDLIASVAVPNVVQWLETFKIKHKPYNGTSHEIISLDPACGSFKFKTMDNPEALVGYETYRSHLDELDTLPEEKAQTVWRKIMGRNRQRPKGVDQSKMKWSEKNKRFEHVNKISAYTTPEGYKFCYKNWSPDHNNPDSPTYNPSYKMVRGKTEDNPTLGESYIEELRASYPANLIEAYMNGEFVNLTAGTVYHCYDKSRHESSLTAGYGDTLYIGCDFNVGKMACTVYKRTNGGLDWHAVDEFCGLLDTPAMIEAIKVNYPNNKIVMYPDSSGGNRTAADGRASLSSISQLRSAGFEVRAHSKNPPVIDRINATNNMFTRDRLFVNSRKCPETSRCFVQQSYDKNGNPDKKSGTDHQNDASTYPIAYECSIVKPLFKLDYSFVTRGDY